jgi:hypothetical protein
VNPFLRENIRPSSPIRVALPLDALLRLHQQLQQVLVGLRGRQAPQKAAQKGQA